MTIPTTVDVHTPTGVVQLSWDAAVEYVNALLSQQTSECLLHDPSSNTLFVWASTPEGPQQVLSGCTSEVLRELSLPTTLLNTRKGTSP